MHLPRWYVETHWLPSIGGNLGKINYREPPPGTGHAERNMTDEYYKIHYDKVNPHQDLLGHLIEDSPETLVGLATAAIAGKEVYDQKKDFYEALWVSVAVGFVSYALAKLLISLISALTHPSEFL